MTDVAMAEKLCERFHRCGLRPYETEAAIDCLELALAELKAARPIVEAMHELFPVGDMLPDAPLRKMLAAYDAACGRTDDRE
ncbi:MAG: hypothetical protein WC683_05985 [bacterium]